MNKTLYSLFFITTLIFVGISHVMSTGAFFADIESTEKNTFRASTLDLGLIATSTNARSREVTTSAEGTVDLEYVMIKSATAGEFCSDVQVTVERNAIETVFDGKLFDFIQSNQLTLGFSEMDNLMFLFSVADVNTQYNGECAIIITYEANQPGYLHNEAYFDTETDSFTLYGEDFGTPEEPSTEPDDGEVILNEIMYDLGEFEGSSADTDREWVEIYNGSAETIDLTQWILRENDINHGINSYNGSGAVLPGQYAIIADDPDTFLNEHPSVSVPVFDSSFQMPNDKNTVILKDPDGIEVDEKTYPQPNPADDLGKSIQLNASGAQWCVGTPTPGLSNTCGGKTQPQIQGATFSSSNNDSEKKQKNNNDLLKDEAQNQTIEDDGEDENADEEKIKDESENELLDENNEDEELSEEEEDKNREERETEEQDDIEDTTEESQTDEDEDDDTESEEINEENEPAKENDDTSDDNEPTE